MLAGLLIMMSFNSELQIFFPKITLIIYSVSWKNYKTCLYGKNLYFSDKDKKTRNIYIASLEVPIPLLKQNSP